RTGRTGTGRGSTGTEFRPEGAGRIQDHKGRIRATQKKIPSREESEIPTRGRELEGFQVFENGPALGGGEAVAVGVAPVRAARTGRVVHLPPLEFGGMSIGRIGLTNLPPDLVFVVVRLVGVERPGVHGRAGLRVQDAVERRYTPVVEVRGGRPYAVQGRG